MKLLDEIKKVWKRLGQADVEVTSENAEKILKAEGNPELISSKTNKKPIVQQVSTKPVRMEDIVQNPKDLENEDREV